jgi:hypothetical protein
MLFKKFSLLPFFLFLFVSSTNANDKQFLLEDTLPVLQGGKAPQNWNEAWRGFDPRKEPLDIEVLKEWEEEEVVLRVLRYRIGVFKGIKAKMACVYGFPKGGKRLPGLVQIHGGGQYADYQAPLTNAKRGYASISISWAGRISAPGYRVSPNEVKLFWEGKTKDPRYRLTTDWGALDAYHAPSRHGKDAFPSIPVAEWTLDSVESPRNNSWFLATLGVRRGLTFLEEQPEVDSNKLGVYGHSMGGKLSVLTAGSDMRVKAAVPSCGGISDRYSSNPLHLATVSDPPSLKNITCPILFLSPSNDFHGRINDLETSVHQIQSKDWRVSCSPHHNHQDSAPYEVGTQIWFDHHLKGLRRVPMTPQLNLTLPDGKLPTASLTVDESEEISSVDFFYTQQGQSDGEKDNTMNTRNRFWHHSPAVKGAGKWNAQLPIFSLDNPLWVYANVHYKLKKPIEGAGYYYGRYKADSYNLSSLMKVTDAAELQSSGVVASLRRDMEIEDFKGEWKKEWFTYKAEKWGVKTHKIYHPMWLAPREAKISIDVKCETPNQLIIGIDGYAAEVSLSGKNQWQTVMFSAGDFKDALNNPLQNWIGIRELRLDCEENLRPPKGSESKSRKVGAEWKGKKPEFRKLQWIN